MLRLVEFSEGFEEMEWCTKGHAGYVLEGSFTIDSKGRLERFTAGDILFIPEGQELGHKAVLGKGERVGGRSTGLLLCSACTHFMF